MRFFSRGLAVRVPHDEPGFYQADFVAEYGVETAKTPGEFQSILDFVTGRLDPTKSAEVLEIGPGPGLMAIQLAKSRRNVRVTGIDISAAFVALANQNSHHEGVADRANFALGDAAEMMGLADASFDAVMSNQSLHYWHPPECVFDQIARVLKPRGVFCIADDRRDMSWQGTFEVLVGRCIHSRRIGSSWARSLLGCFTPAEVTDALQRSALRDRWQMTIRPRSMVISSKPE